MGKGLDLFVQKYPALLPRIEAGLNAGGFLVSWSADAVSVDALLDRWISSLKLTKDMAIALSGVGTGSHIVRLLKELPEGGCIFCAEPDCSVFARFADTKTGIRLLKDSRVFWGVGELDSNFFASMQTLPILEVFNIESVVFAPLFNKNEQYYSRFFLEFARQWDNWRKLYRTNVLWSALWQRNSLKNLNTLVSAPDMGAFRGVFKGVPMIVASAGPSLDESLDFIREAQSHAVIVAMNSSFRVLRNAGIDPHFVLAADPHSSTDLGFANVEIGRSLLLCPFLVYPNATTRFKGRAITWSGTNKMITYLRSKLKQPESVFVLEQGTVAACAFDLAKVFGCSSMFFAGQDLAAKADGQMHASDSFYMDTGSDKVDLSKVRWVPGNTYEKVPVEEKLFVYLKVFEQMATEHGDAMKLVNLSRLGAQITGIPYVPLEDAKALMPSIDEIALESSWNSVEAACAKEWMPLDSVKGEMRALREYAQSACSIALRGALLLEQGGEDFGAQLSEAKKIHMELTSLFQSNAAYGKLLEDGQLKAEMLTHKRFVRLLDRNEGNFDKELETKKSFFWSIAEGAYSLLSSLDEAEIVA